MEADRRLTRLEILEGAFVGAIVKSLLELGIFESLERPQSAAELAKGHNVNAAMLAPLLEYLSQRSELLDRVGDLYKRGTPAKNRRDEDCLLGLYLRTYGPNLAHLAEVLRNPASAPQLVDRVSYAKAFELIDRPGFPEMTDVLSQIGSNNVLDIGCGPASLLVSLAKRDPKFRGWGIDASEEMCQAARRRIAASELERRIRVFHGNELTTLPREVKKKVQVLVACSLLNEFCSGEKEEAIAWLRVAGEVFPRRTLIIADYYGELNGSGEEVQLRGAMLHDIVQVISGQGIPPASMSDWKGIYEAAGCTLLHVVHFECSRFRRFLHFVSLQSAGMRNLAA
jgi:SAM-dependent methyltransferase